MISQGPGFSPVGAVVQAIMEGFTKDRVLVIDPPGSLQNRVQQTVSSCAVPQGVETAVQACPQLQGPVNNWRLFFQLYGQNVKWK